MSTFTSIFSGLMKAIAFIILRIFWQHVGKIYEQLTFRGVTMDNDVNIAMNYHFYAKGDF